MEAFKKIPQRIEGVEKKMANEKRLIYLEDAIALLECDIADSKASLITAYHGDKETIRSEMNGVRAAISILKNHAKVCGTVDAVEVVHGRWRFCGSDRWNDAYECTVCGKMAMDNSNYCPNCGADMRERKDNVSITD